MSLRPRMGRVDQHPSPLQPLGGDQVDEGLLLRVQPLLRQRRRLDDDVLGPWIEDRLAPGASVGVGQQRLEVCRQEPLGTGLEGHRQSLPQFREHLVVGAALGVARRVLFGVHRREHHLFLVGRQPGCHVRQAQEDGVADDVEEGRGHEARPLPDHLAELAAPAVAPVLDGVVIGLSDGVLLEAVAGDPAALLGAPELRPDLGGEPVEEVEERRAVASHQGSGQAEGLAADIGQNTGGDALRRAAPLVLVDLVTDQQVEEAVHPVLNVVRKRVASGTGPVGLPEGRTAVGAGALSAVQVGIRQGDSVLVHDLRGAVGAAWHLERLPGLLVPQQPALRRGPPLNNSGHPAVGQLGPLSRHHDEEGAGADGDAQPLQVGDGGDDGCAGAGHRLLDLPFPLLCQVGRAEDENPPEADHLCGGGGDEGLACPHLSDDGCTPVGIEGQGRAPDGVLLRPQGSAEQVRKLATVTRSGLGAGLRGPVERRVGLDHPPGYGVLERVDELSEVHGVSPFLREPHGTSGARLLREAASGGPGAGRTSPTPLGVCA